MRAAQIVSLEGPEVVQVNEVSVPEPRDNQITIRVHAAGVTFPDVLQTRGLYQLKPSLPFIPGTEAAGVVEGIGPKAKTNLQIGDRVVAFPGLGGFGEVMCVDDNLAWPLPDNLSFSEGAGIPMNILTMHFALARRAQMQSGETLLVHGAGGGIGCAAIQYAHAMGNRVIAVASSEEKRAIALKSGADEAIHIDGFLEAAKELTGGKGVDIVVDPVGGDRFTDSLRSLCAEGKLLVIGFTGGSIPEVRVNRLLLNNISVVGVGWGSYFLQHPEYLTTQWEELLPLFKKGSLTPIVGATYDLDNVSAALAQMDKRGALGKIVIEIGK